MKATNEIAKIKGNMCPETSIFEISLKFEHIKGLPLQRRTSSSESRLSRTSLLTDIQEK